MVPASPLFILQPRTWKLRFKPRLCSSDLENQPELRLHPHQGSSGHGSASAGRVPIRQCGELRGNETATRAAPLMQGMSCPSLRPPLRPWLQRTARSSPPQRHGLHRILARPGPSLDVNTGRGPPLSISWTALVPRACRCSGILIEVRLAMAAWSVRLWLDASRAKKTFVFQMRPQAGVCRTRRTMQATPVRGGTRGALVVCCCGLRGAVVVGSAGG
jgi:hypothetical protein